MVRPCFARQQPRRLCLASEGDTDMGVQHQTRAVLVRMPPAIYADNPIILQKLFLF
jgi:hypothetical protein